MPRNIPSQEFTQRNSASDWGDMFAASFRQDNLVGSAISHDSWKEWLSPTNGQRVGSGEISAALAESGLNAQAEMFLDVQTQGELDAKIHDVQMENTDRQTLENGGFWSSMLTSGVAGTLDVTSLIPFGKAMQLGTKGMMAVGYAAPRLAAVSAVDATISELGLHATQETRTVGESAFAIGGGVILNTALGTGISKLMGRKVYNDLSARSEQDLKDIESGKFDEDAQAHQTAQMKLIDENHKPQGELPKEWENLSPSEIAFAKSAGVEGATRGTFKIFGRSMQLEMMNAKNPAMKMFASHTFDLSMQTKGAQDGVANPISIQNSMARYDGLAGEVHDAFNAGYKEFRGGALNVRNSPLLDVHNWTGREYGRYSEEVTKAMLMGDHHDPAVMKAAKAARKVHDQIYERGVEVGLFSKADYEGDGPASDWTDLDLSPMYKSVEQNNGKQLKNPYENQSSTSVSVDTGNGQRGFIGSVTDNADDLGNLFGTNLIERGNYIHRVYTPRMSEDYFEFRGLEERAWLQNREKMIADGTWADSSWGKGKSQTPYAQLTKQQKLQVAQSARSHARGSAWEIVHGSNSKGGKKSTGAGQRSYMKERNVLLSDAVLLKKGWISSDILEINTHITRTMGVDIELAKKFRKDSVPGKGKGNAEKYGDTEPDLAMEKFRQDQDEWYRAEIDKAHAKNDILTIDRLSDERARFVGGKTSRGQTIDVEDSDMFAVRDLLRGTYKTAQTMSTGSRYLAATRNFIYTAKMGGNLLTSVPDIAVQAWHHGPIKFTNHLAKRIAAMPMNGGGLHTEANSRLSRAAGITGQMQLIGQISAALDIHNPTQGGRMEGGFEKLSRAMARGATRVYGIQMWTDFIRATGTAMSTERIVSAIMNPGALKKAELAHMADLGLSAKVGARIKKQILKGGGTDEKGFWELDLRKWDDDDAGDAMLAMLRKDANIGNVMATTLDKPKAMHNPFMSTILQFSSFTMKSTQTLLGRSAQRLVHDGGLGADSLRVYTGIGMMVAMGMLTAKLHDYADNWYTYSKGEEPDHPLPTWEDNPAWWTYQGFERSGLTGVFGWMANIGEGMGLPGPQLAAHTVLGDEDNNSPVARYGDFGGPKALFGPTHQLISDATTVLKGVSRSAADPDYEISGSVPKAIKRNLPFANAFYIRWLTNEALQHVSEEWLEIYNNR